MGGAAKLETILRAAVARWSRTEGSVRREARKALNEIHDDYPLTQDEYGDWALSVIDRVQGLVDALGLYGFTVVSEHGSTDDHIDGLALRAPWGNETSIPDGVDGGDKRTAKAAREQAAFFVARWREVQVDPLARAITLLVKAHEETPALRHGLIAEAQRALVEGEERERE